MINDKNHSDMNSLERDRTCEFWLTNSWANGFCRIISECYTCHYSEQKKPNCPIVLGYIEGQKQLQKERDLFG